jgi:hypothetical protein
MTTMTACALLALMLAPPADVSWPDLVQKPNARLPLRDLGLKPLLDAPGGKIADAAGWKKERERLRAAWLERLGPSPAVPKKLDAVTLMTEKRADHSESLVRFRTEGDDFLRAYLLVPAGLKPKEKRPTVVVFHQTSRETFEEPVGRGKKKELALGLHLVARGYVVLCPECYILKDPKG